MKSTNTLTLFAFLVAFLGSSLSLAAQNPEEFRHFTHKKLNKIEDEELVCGYLSLYVPEKNAELKGKSVVRVARLSSNFDGSYFKKYEDMLTLDQPISKEFIKWADQQKPPRLVFKPMEKNGETIYKIVGYTSEAARFLPKKELFPEFEGIELVDFSVKENLEKYKDKHLIAGGPGPLKRMRDPKHIDIHYPTELAFGKDTGMNLYMTYIHLSEPISELVQEYLSVYPVGDLVFEKVSNKSPKEEDESFSQKGTFKLVGFTRATFSFNETWRQD